MKIRMVCTPQGLVPAYEDDLDKKSSLKQGKTYVVDVKEVRNPKFHNLVIKMLKVSWEMCSPFVQEHFHNNFDLWRKTVLLAAGCSETIYSIERREFIETYKSISFDTMPESEFQSYFERIKDVLYTTFLTHLNRNEVEKIIERF